MIASLLTGFSTTIGVCRVPCLNYPVFDIDALLVGDHCMYVNRIKVIGHLEV